jgi:hypothetical protein
MAVLIVPVNYFIAARRRFQGVGLQRKSAVYGLNGHRAHFVIALALGAYEYAI